MYKLKEVNRERPFLEVSWHIIWSCSSETTFVSEYLNLVSHTDMKQTRGQPSASNV